MRYHFQIDDKVFIVDLIYFPFFGLDLILGVDLALGQPCYAKLF